MEQQETKKEYQPGDTVELSAACRDELAPIEASLMQIADQKCAILDEARAYAKTLGRRMDEFDDQERPLKRSLWDTIHKHHPELENINLNHNKKTGVVSIPKKTPADFLRSLLSGLGPF